MEEVVALALAIEIVTLAVQAEIPFPQVMEETIEVVEVFPREQNVDMPMLQISEQIVNAPGDVDAAILRFENWIRDNQ